MRLLAFVLIEKNGARLIRIVIIDQMYGQTNRSSSAIQPSALFGQQTALLKQLVEQKRPLVDPVLPGGRSPRTFVSSNGTYVFRNN